MTTVGFIGLGAMGLPMAKNLAAHGFTVRGFDMRSAAVDALAEAGGVPASSAAEAARGANVLVLMVVNAAQAEAALFGGGALDVLPPNGIVILMATCPPGSVEAIAARVLETGRRFVDAPVSGSEGPARDGELVILASGPEHVRPMLAPVFGVLGRATAWLGPAGHGTRAKLVLNSWLADLTEATAETLSFARRLNLDPAGIVDLLQSTPLGAPYAVQKARSMLAGDFSPAFALKHALKDAELAAQAAQASGATLTLTSALLPRWRDTAASGHADDDLSAVYLTT